MTVLGSQLGRQLRGQRRTLAVAVVLATAGVGLSFPTPAHGAADPRAGSGASASPAAPQSAAPYIRRGITIGRSVRGRAIRAYYRGTKDAKHVLVVLGQMHGDERAGRRTAWWVRDRVRPRDGTGVWIVPSMNPDGNARGTRTNARRVDLNRNWPTSGWSGARRGTRYWGGPRPASEPETRAMIAFLREVRPDYIASIHQPLYGIGRHRGGIRWQERLSRNLDLPRRFFGVGNPRGTVSPTLTGWYSARFRDHGVATTIEYGARPGRRFVTVKAGRGITAAARVR
ncbi:MULTISPECIES: M14 family zinc carboxypeptidase [Nocardioides]|uniref:M14 family zinc carboxypeptidase n=1 Tax=Nocardioides vastitatis TaxID=2568655 RepID=A0ABW0ZE34_9ACTN|nr:M14 family zinc carboxypeptidase [Nocardioides sp.]THJ05992.1 murein peptide amidase A [Nocardioides sp.]